MKKRLLLIGAGPTSSLIAYNVKTCPRLSEAFEVSVWEKSKGTGGRFATSRSPSDPKCYADLGAQYLTWNGNVSSKPYFEKLSSQELLRTFDTSKIPGFRNDPSKTNYVCSSGTASIVKFYFDQAGVVPIHFNVRAESISLKDGDKLEVAAENGVKEVFDAVVSTMPVPQLLLLKNMDKILESKPALKSNLESVKYTSRYAMGLFYDSQDVLFQKTVQPINFIDSDSIVRYWSVENKKRAAGLETQEPCAVVVHTSTKYGAEHSENTPDSMKNSLYEVVKGSLDPLKSTEPSNIKCHKWKYSQVESSYPDKPGCIPITKSFIGAGDGFSYSGFEGCIESAEKTVEHLKSLLKAL